MGFSSFLKKVGLKHGFDPVSFTYMYGREQGLTPTESATNAFTGGMFVNAFQGAAEGRAGEARYQSEQARVEAEQAERDGYIRQLRGVYGIGEDGEAQQNARTLADFLRTYYEESLGANLGAVDQQYASTSRRSRQNLARVGQLGSGLDAQSQAGNLSDYLRARQQAVMQASGARDRLNTGLTGQRMSFENQIASGGMASPDFAGIAAQRDAQLAQAQAQIAPAAVGHLFNVAGAGYQNGRIQEAVGNQGMQAFGFGGGGSSGRIS
ncbi:MAG TPA: hypothetical protein VEL07_19215 [Planctomycetota bacterium]|nr:hypothetical protein [Planctomycetota bacterium]